MTDTNEEKELDVNSDAAATEPEPEQTPGEMSEEYREMVAGLPPIDIYSLLKSFIAMLNAQTWQWLGLVKNPATGNLDKDLAQAKVAIDTISLLIDKLGTNLNPSEQREMQSLLSDLRINFVQQSGKP